MEIFDTHLEFDPNELYRKINLRIASGKPGYVCVCDSSVITRVHNDLSYRDVINGAFVNSCDGSSICTLAKKIYGGNLVSVNGPEIFEKYTQSPYKQVILGNTTEIVTQVRNKLRSLNIKDDHIDHMDLPFCTVDQFDYKDIAADINKHHYEIIWVSLGNPKQEIFMSKILPFINHGVMFGIGAALNFWVGDLSLPKFHIGSFRFIWFTRLFEDPIRQIKMNSKIIPSLIKIYKKEKEKKKKRKNKNQ